MKKQNDKDTLKTVLTSSRTKSWGWLIFAYSFMICFFAPLESYFVNQEEFWFTFIQILPIVLGVFFINIVFLLTIFLCIKKTKMSVYLYEFIFCTMLYFYVQGNYVPRNYGVFNGMDIQWNNYPMYSIVSIVLILCFLILGIIISVKVKEKIFEIGRWICIGLTLVQIVTLLILGIENGIGKKETTVVTTENMFNLSKNRNIIVFILDQFDSADMQDLLNGDEGEQYKEILKDFTYYPDTIGRYPSTLGSLPYILTGIKYESGETYRDWVDNGFANSAIYSAMKENGYSVGLYTYPRFVNPDYAINVERADYIINNPSRFAKTMYKLVAFNYMPHQLKKFFNIESEEFEKLKTSKNYDVYSADTLWFYKLLKSEKLNISDRYNNFKVYHVEGTHPPYTFGEHLISEPDKEYNVYDEAEGCLHLLDEYMRMLKEAEIYDNTSIIVMADHGYHGLWQNPIFLIKNFDENHKLTVSNTKMSWDYLDEIFVSLASGKKIDDMFIQKCASDSSMRNFSYYTWDNDKWDKKYMPEITDYIAYGEATDLNKFECTSEFPYCLGDILSFGKEETAQKYCLYGIGTSEGSGAWTNEHYAIMQFDWIEGYEDILIDIEYGNVSAPPQTVNVYVNQHKVAEFIAKEAGNQEIVIPHDVVDEGRMTLSFEFPDSISPRDRGTGKDVRNLALYINTIKISAADKID